MNSGEATPSRLDFEKWCELKNTTVSEGRVLNLLSANKDLLIGVSKVVAGVVPAHYSSPDRIAHILKKLGKSKAAAYVREKLPKGKKPRSGDLGEILATQYIDECTEYDVPIRRLRWKDHREMAMRGDDVIGIGPGEGDFSIRFIKSETKSRLTLSTAVVSEARLALNDNGGLPSPHALAFVADRLHGMGNDELADLITVAQLDDGIAQEQVEHLLFTFSGNAPGGFLKADLDAYDGSIKQNSVGLHIPDHQEFIATVYKTVEENHGP